MLKYSFYIFCLLMSTSLPAQDDKKKPLDNLIKVTAADSLSPVNELVKKQLVKLLDKRRNDPSAETQRLRLLFTDANARANSNAGRWMAARLQKDIYCINLSVLASRYIGETEKNLELIFNKAAANNWILFFDEADALFGKSSTVKDADGKYANQEIAYLLERIEAFNGIVLMACTGKDCTGICREKHFITIADQ